MFESFIDNLQREFSIIGLTETWLTPVNADLHTLPGYCHVYRCRQGRQGGGVSLFISNNLPFIVRQDLTVLTDQVEQLFIEIDKSSLHVKKNVIVGITYRPPDKDSLVFNDTVQTALAKIDKQKKFGYLLGYFNLNLLKSEIHNPTLDFLNSLFSYSFWPLITRPTRVTSSAATLIDSIFTNNIALKMFCVNVIVINDITDNFPIFHIGKDVVINEEKKIIFKRNFTHKAQLLFTSLLQDVDWSCILNESDTNKAYAMCVHVYSAIYDKAFPKTRAKIKYYHRKPWLTEVLKNSIRQKNKLFKLSKKYPVADSVVKCKTYRSTLNKLLKRGEKLYYQELFSGYRDNMQKTWSVIKRILNKSKGCVSRSMLKHDNETIADDYSIANTFNNFFVGSDLANRIPDPPISPYKYMKTEIMNSIFPETVSPEELLEVIKGLKHRAVGYDELGAQHIKSSSSAIIQPLLHICNLSFTHGVFPEAMKIAKVIPLFKSGNDMKVNNYRPVSILPVLWKILEK